MIVPAVAEADWLDLLQSADEWAPPSKATLIISPHPDDETLGAGGLIATQNLRDLSVTVAAVTDGEAAYAGVTTLADTRRPEQDKAVHRLGLRNAVVRLGLPDSGLAKHESELENALRPLIHAGMLVAAPWINDWHPDHEACARVANKLCLESGAELISYLFWTWHQRETDVFRGFHLLRLSLAPTVLAAKRAALACHVSQFQYESQEPILPNRLLAPAFRPFETFINHV